MSHRSTFWLKIAIPVIIFIGLEYKYIYNTWWNQSQGRQSYNSNIYIIALEVDRYCIDDEETIFLFLYVNSCSHAKMLSSNKAMSNPGQDKCAMSDEPTTCSCRLVGSHSDMGAEAHIKDAIKVTISFTPWYTQPWGFTTLRSLIQIRILFMQQKAQKLQHAIFL